MLDAFPLSLGVAWVAFYCFLLGHYHHDRQMSAEFDQPRTLYIAVSVSIILGCLTAIGIIIYFVIASTWYWALAFPILGIFPGAFIAGLLFGVVGEKLVSILAFAGWPISAMWAISIIHSIQN